MGSGSLAAMAVFESKWKPNMSRQDAMELVSEAIEAGIFNDLGSGSNVDVCVVEKSGTEMIRGYKRPNEKVAKQLNYKWRRGVTAVMKEEVRKFDVVDEQVVHLTGGTVEGVAGSSMEVDA